MDPIIESIAWLVGFLIIFIYSYNFFNAKRYYLEDPEGDKGDYVIPSGFTMPVYPKYLIDQWQYKLWFFSYFLINFALYLVFSIALYANKSSIDLSSLGNLQQLIYTTYPQLLGALIISGLLPNLPERLDLQKWVRDYAQTRASIPEVARGYYNNIINKGLRIPEDGVRRTIKYHSDAIVNDSDFKFRPQSPENKWAHICYLHFMIESYTDVANSIYSRNLNKAELAYKNFKRNFKRVRNDLITNNQRVFSPPVNLCIDRLFSQAAQIIVCLIFCSEPNDERAKLKFKELGLRLAPDTVYNIRFDILFPLSVIIFLAVFVLPFFIVALLDTFGLELPPRITGEWSYRSAVAAVLIVYLPILITHVVKYWSPNKWPVRNFFDRLKLGPPCLMFIVGVLVGIGAFYFLEIIFSGMFENGVERNLGFSSISGVTAVIAALHIDQKPKVWRPIRAFGRSLVWSFGTAILFAFGCAISLLWEQSLEIQAIFSRSFLLSNLFIIFLGAATGFVTGMVISLASEYALRIKEPHRAVDLTLAHYLIPAVRKKDQQITANEMNNLIETTTNLPSRFIHYLIKNQILDNDRKITPTGYERIKRLAFA